MADRAHVWTDWKIDQIEKELEKIYDRAEKELEARADQYFKRFSELDQKKRALLDSGKISESEYAAWRKGKIMIGKHWTAMKQEAAEQMLHVNQTAAAYVNDQLAKVYVRNYNQVASEMSSQLRGYSFDLVDSSTIRRLATDNKTLLPYRYIDGVKDVRWNTQKVNSEVLQGILQGDSIPNLAKRLGRVTEMNKTSAIRNARTSCTSAENKGRMDMLENAESKGVHAKKGWMATNDDRTRDSHADLNGTFIEPDETFENGCEYPGDPNGAPEEVYNCRCTLIYKVVSIGGTMIAGAGNNQYEPQGVNNQEPDSIRLPDTMFKEKQSIALEGFLDGVEGKNADVAELFGTIGEKAAEQNYNIKVSYTGGDHQVTTAQYIRTGDIQSVSVRIPQMTGDLADKAETTVHELGHLLDQMYGGNNYLSASNSELIEAISNGNPMSESTKALFEQLKINGDNAYNVAMEAVRAKNSEYNEQISELFGKHDYAGIKQIQKERDKAWKDGVRAAAEAQRAEHKGYAALEDIYDAITGGKLYSQGYYGHGSKYYSRESNRAAETFANYCSLSQVNPDVFDILKKEQPDIFAACSKLVEEMLGR